MSPPRRLDQPADHLQQRGLAATARPDDRDEIAPLDGEVDFVKGMDFAAAGGEIALGDAGNPDRHPGPQVHGGWPGPIVDHEMQVPTRPRPWRTRLHGSAIRSAKATALNRSTPSNDSTTTAANSSGVSSRTWEMSWR